MDVFKSYLDNEIEALQSGAVWGPVTLADNFDVERDAGPLTVLSSFDIPMSAFAAIVCDGVNQTTSHLSYDNTTGIFTVVDAGWYLVLVIQVWTVDTVGSRGVAMFNPGQLGGGKAWSATDHASSDHQFYSPPIHLAIGDTFIFGAVQNSGSSLDLTFVELVVTKVA